MHLFCRCKQWVINCKTVNLDNKTSEQLYSNYLVCGEHFEDRMFMNPITRNSLVHNAIPTVFAFPGGFTSSPLFDGFKFTARFVRVKNLSGDDRQTVPCVFMAAVVGTETYLFN